MQIAELSERSGVTTRNIRKYIAMGIVLPPIGRTKNATYSTDHLDDLLKVRELLAQRSSLASVKAALDQRRKDTPPSNDDVHDAHDLGLRGDAHAPLALEIADGIVVLVMGNQEAVRKNRDVVVAGFRRVLDKARLLSKH